MNIDPSEAGEALKAIRLTEQKLTQDQNAWGGGYHLIVWGVICMIGFTISQFNASLPAVIGRWAWITLNIVGNIISWSIGFRMRTKFQNTFGIRIALLWVLFVAFGVLAAFFVHPANPQELTILLLLIINLWLAVMGLWLNLTMLWESLAFTVCMLAGYYLIPEYFFLCLAVVCGGIMILAGVFAIRKEK
ncbi:MAG TPA: hypothetical protein VN376_01370 [Longilinea sp.]|nr:hypothetical protein [Longilinea sp.]